MILEIRVRSLMAKEALLCTQFLIREGVSFDLNAPNKDHDFIIIVGLFNNDLPDAKCRELVNALCSLGLKARAVTL